MKAKKFRVKIKFSNESEEIKERLLFECFDILLSTTNKIKYQKSLGGKDEKPPVNTPYL